MTTTRPHPSAGKSIMVLALFILIPLAIGFAGSMLTTDNIDGWYAAATKASWNPPNSVFGPVWTVLYILIGVAGWEIWRHRDRLGTARLMRLYWAQLFLNSVWSPIFFGGYPALRATALWLAFIVIVGLWITVALLIKESFSHGFKLAAWLLVPYLLWVSYASTLNIYLALFN